MEKQSVLNFVGSKLAESDPAMAQAKAMQGDKYLEWIGKMPLSTLKPALKASVEASVRYRLDLKPHKCAFYAPTINQWITDLLGRYTKDDVLEIFVQASGLNKKAFRTGTFGKNLMTRPLIEDLVEILEQATGRKLDDAGYKKDEDDYPYQRIATCFANV